ncbi:hypothetical protein G7054_g12211 [Neopestalotiopsis clavispora]|nr:hypothetical protein G7054_g12211 [Neopestalotiopsis clavispora]
MSPCDWHRPRWLKKAKNKITGKPLATRFEGSLAEPESTHSKASPATEPIAPALPESETPKICPETPDDLSIAEQLWQEAYSEVGKKEPNLVESFEFSIRQQLGQDEPKSDQGTPKGVAVREKPTPSQMQQLVQEGIERTKTSANVKQAFGAGLSAIQPAKDIMDRVVGFAPQAAIPWAGICLGLEILANPLSEALSNRDGIAYVLTRINWYWDLAPFLLDKNPDDHSFTGLQRQLATKIGDLYQQLLKYQLRSICLYHRNWAETILRDTIKFDDWAGQLSGIKNLENDVQKHIEQYNSAHAKSKLQRLTDTAETILSGLHSFMRQQEVQDQSEKDSKCLRHLLVTDPRDDKERIENKKGGLLADSYSWVLEHVDFLRFRNFKEGGVLWIKGDPGKGKTMLLCGIINHLERDVGHRERDVAKENLPYALSCFFCEATVAESSNATSVLRGLVYDLARQNRSLIKHIREEFEEKGAKLFDGVNAWQEIERIATAVLNDPSLKDVIIVIDALDECTTDRERLLDFISSFPTTKWIVTSRNLPEIEKLNSIEHMIKLQLEDNRGTIAKAVDAYIKNKVDCLAREKNFNQQTKHDVHQYLIENAHETFLWVALVCAELEKPRVKKGHHAMKVLKSFPSGLEELYARMLKHISESLDAELCYRILALATTVYRPITLEELEGLVQFPEEYVQDEICEIITSCGSFLNLSNKRGVISFVHQSAKDFLEKNPSVEIEGKPPFHILGTGIEYQHKMVFVRSLELLGENLRRDICGLGAPAFRADQVSPSNLAPLAKIQYSSVTWVDHLEKSGFGREAVHDVDHSEAVELLINFVKTEYLHWLEALSLMRSISAGVKAISKLNTILTKTDTTELHALVQDALRFVLSHRVGIELAPLQAYTSALIFSPTNSLIRKTFQLDKPSWVELNPRLEADWDASLQMFEGHNSVVPSIACSNDGLLASGSWDHTIKLWDTVSGACTHILKGHEGYVTYVDFSANGLIASSSKDETIKIWDANSGHCVQTLKGHEKEVNSVAFSSNGQVASGSGDGTVKVWDLASGECIRNRLQLLKGDGDDSVQSIAFSTNGQRIASIHWKGTIHIWSATSGDRLITLESPGPVEIAAKAVAWLAENRIATIWNLDSIKVWDVSAHRTQAIESHQDDITCIALSPDGQYIASASVDTTIKVWDKSGNCIKTLIGHHEPVYSVIFSGDGRFIATCCWDGVFKIWETPGYNCVKTLNGLGKHVSRIAVTEDFRFIASRYSDEAVKIWDTSGNCIHTLLGGYFDSVDSIIFSADGHHLAVCKDDSLTIWEVTGTLIRKLQNVPSVIDIVSIAISKDGTRIGMCSHEKATIWDVTSGQCRQTLEGYYKSADVIINSTEEQLAARHLSSDLAGFWFSSDRCWITWNGEAFIWLPLEYRPREESWCPLVVASTGQSIAIGTNARRVWTMQLARHIENMMLA